MLKSFADWLVFSIMGLAPGTRAGEALDFFIYDAIKIFLLLTAIILVVAVTGRQSSLGSRDQGDSVRKIPQCWPNKTNG